MSIWQRIKGGWREFAEPAPTPEAEQGKALVNVEVATSEDGRDITRGYVDGLPLLLPEDHILVGKMGGDLEGYQAILSDPEVKIAWDQRALGLIAREWYVEPGADNRASKKAADQLREILQHIGWDEATRKMQLGVFWGRAFAECLWAQDGQHITLDTLKIKKPKRFEFRPDGTPVLLTMRQPTGEPLPPRKFWRFASGALDDDEPYGLGLAHWLYWPVWFRRNGDKFWAWWLEAMARKPVIGKHPPNAEKEQKALVLKALRAIHESGRVAISDNMTIEALKAIESSGGDYDKFTQRWISAIYRLIIGQDFSITGAGGQYKGDNLMDVQRSIIKADADLINVSFARQVGTWLTDWNWPGATPPRVWRRVEDAPDLAKLSDTHSKLFTVGYRPTLAQVSEAYGGEWEPVPSGATPPQGAINPPPPEGGATVELAEGGVPAQIEGPDLADLMMARMAREAAPLVERDLLAPIRAALDDAIANGQTLAQFGEQLPGLFDRMDGAALADLLAAGLMAAEMGGRYELQDGQ